VTHVPTLLSALTEAIRLRDRRTLPRRVAVQVRECSVTCIVMIALCDLVGASRAHAAVASRAARHTRQRGCAVGATAHAVRVDARSRAASVEREV
jgi:hypothetical protein